MAVRLPACAFLHFFHVKWSPLITPLINNQLVSRIGPLQNRARPVHLLVRLWKKNPIVLNYVVYIYFQRGSQVC